VLVPELAGSGASSAAGELAPLRQACRAAIGALGEDAAQLVVLGAGPVSLAHSPVAYGTLAGYGLPGDFHLGSPACGGAAELPLSLTIAAWLLGDVLGPRNGAVGFSVGPDFAASRAGLDLLGLVEQQDVALVVMGDGSARRDLKAPGYLDDRAAEFDAGAVAALAAGDPAGLGALDAELGAQLLAAGVPVWRAAADVLSGSYDAEVTFDAAPYGVAYFVASWRARD
jgi:hypothetical protein